MELLERYLQAVKKYLPLRRQDDILAELRANMESQIEDRESELGRPLSIGETEDWLRTFGPPFMVAMRYQPQHYLIGPALFPTYWYVMRLAFMWSMVIYAVVSAIQIVFQSPSSVAIVEALLRAPGVLLNVATWVTLVFAAFEFVTTYYPNKVPTLAGMTAKWHPASLPPLEENPPVGGKQRSYAQACAEVIFGFLFLAWLLLIPHYPFLLMGPGVVYLHVAPFQLSSVWWTFYWWIVALNVVQLAWRSIDLARGAWQRSSRVRQVIFKAMGLIPIAVLLTARDHIYVSLKNPAVDQARYGHNLDQINNAIHLGFTVICAIVVLQLAFDLGRIALDAYRNREAAD